MAETDAVKAIDDCGSPPSEGDAVGVAGALGSVTSGMDGDCVVICAAEQCQQARISMLKKFALICDEFVKHFILSSLNK